MSSALSPVKVATAACSLILLVAGVWVLCGYVWPTYSNPEVAAVQAMVDPGLFQRDFVVQEAMHFSPRFYYSAMIVALARTGLPLAWVFVVWHLAALAVLIASFRSLVRTLGVGAVASAVLLVWLIFVRIGTVGLTFTYQNAPVPAMWAIAAVAAGAALAVRGRTSAAYACFGGAALLQFLVGFYAGVLALPLLWRASPRQRVGALALWALGLALVYLPMRLAATTDSGVLASPAFVEIYAQLHLPHHLVPSSWGWPIWIQFAVFYAGAGWFLHRTAAGRSPTERVVFNFTMAVMVVGLVLNYVFVELHPVALVAKLQPARITPLAQCVVLTLLALRVQTCVVQKDWLRALLLALIPLSLFPGLLLLLAAVLTTVGPSRSKFPWPTVLLAIAVVLTFQPFEESFGARTLRYGLCAALFLLQLIAAWLEDRPRRLAVAAALAAAGAALCARASLRPDWPPFLMIRFAVDAAPIDPEGILGRRFGARSHPDAIVLLPPDGEAWSFKLHARRAVVVDTKSVPFSDRGLREWQVRMEDVLGRPIVRGMDLDAAWKARTPEQLFAVAQRYHARYLLTRDDWHPTMIGRRIDQEQGWSLWQLY